MKRMKVVEFQLQIHEGEKSALSVLHEIDPQAPIPQPLEGGNMKGPLYQCILREEKQQEVEAFCKKNPSISVYTSFDRFELDETLYRPDWYVHWQWRSNPTVKQEK